MPIQPKSFLKAGEFLVAGDYLRAPNHRYVAVLQGDGNLCVFRGDSPSASYKTGLWHTGITAGGGKFFLILQTDGNLVVYKGTGPGDNKGLLWGSQRTASGGEFFLILQEDGNLCVYVGTDPADQRQLLWDSHRFDAAGRGDISASSTAIDKAIRTLVLGALKQIPKAGALVSGLIGFLWPEPGKDSWAQMRSRIEALINQRLADFKYQEVKDWLNGLKNVLDGYTLALDASRNSSASYITEKYNAAVSHFEAASPHFKTKDYEMLLLPLFAQMANMHLSLLRDGVLHGAEWGWTEKIRKSIDTNLKNLIKTYGDWAQRWYQKSYETFSVPSRGNNKKAWAARNHYVRSMTLQVLDYAFYWPYFDPSAGAPPKLTRELYSDPHGSADATENPLNVDGTVRARLAGLTVWGGNRIDAVQQRFGSDDWGPRQGSSTGGSDHPPGGWTGIIRPDNPVVEVLGFAGEVVGGIILVFKDGTRTHLCGRADGAFYACFLEGHVLSQVYISGKNHFYRVAETIICGFRVEESY